MHISQVCVMYVSCVTCASAADDRVMSGDKSRHYVVGDNGVERRRIWRHTMPCSVMLYNAGSCRRVGNATPCHEMSHNIMHVAGYMGRARIFPRA